MIGSAIKAHSIDRICHVPRHSIQIPTNDGIPDGIDCEICNKEVSHELDCLHSNEPLDFFYSPVDPVVNC